MKLQRPKIPKAFLRKKNKAGSITQLTSNYTAKKLQECCALALAQEQSVKVRITIQSPDINPCMYGRLIYSEGGKNKMRKGKFLQ